jgi:hypothetical protein
MMPLLEPCSNCGDGSGGSWETFREPSDKAGGRGPPVRVWCVCADCNDAGLKPPPPDGVRLQVVGKVGSGVEAVGFDVSACKKGGDNV